MAVFLPMIVLVANAALASEVVTVGYASYRPLMGRSPDRQPAGFAIDVFDEAARREGIAIRWKFLPNVTPDEALQSGEADLWPAVVDTAERRTGFHLSSVWWRNELQLLTRADLPLHSVGDFQGRRISAVSRLQQAAPAIRGATLTERVTHDEATAAMCTGEVEAVLLDRLRIDRALLRRVPECRDIALRVIPIPGGAVNLAVMARREHRETADRLRSSINDLASDGTLARIALRHPPISSTSAEQIAAAVTSGYQRILLVIGLPFAAALILAGTAAIVRLKRTSTSRRHALLKLEESEARFRTLIETAPQLVWSARSDGFCEYLSRQWYDFTGAAESDHLGFGWVDALHPEDRERTVAEFRKSAETGSLFSTQYRLRRRDGQYRWFQTRALPLRESPESTQWMGTCSDIDDQKRSENELRLRNDQLEQFGWAVSHDLQEPLRMIVSYSQLLQRRFADQLGANGGEFVRNCVEGARRIESLLHGLRDYWAAGAPDGDTVQSVNLAAAVEAAVDVLRPSITEVDATIVYGSLPDVIAEHAGIVAVMQNLIANAVKYRHPHRAPSIQISATVTEGFCFVRVRDNGIGVDEKYKETIFGMFKRLHGRATYPGNGIGLALCHKVVERHGGKIWVESNEEEGCTFCFTVPAYRQPQARPAHA